MMRRRAVALALTLPLLGGCGVAADIAGVHDAPAESTDGGSITVTTAQEVVSRVLADARTTRSGKGGKGAESRKEVLTGPALREAEAAAKTRTTADTGKAAEAQVLAVSRGPEWPRTILATSRSGPTQRLHVLVAEGADKPYRLFADVPMAAGASVPALDEPTTGSPSVVADAADGKTAEAVEAWSKAVAFPAPKKSPSGIEIKDAYSTALRKNAKAQDKDLDDLAKYRQEQTPADGKVVTFDLVQGGEISFVPMTRTDTITAGEKLKELKISDSSLARLVDAKSVKKKLEVTHAETIVVVTPEKGDASVVAASEQVQGAKGS